MGLCPAPFLRRRRNTAAQLQQTLPPSPFTATPAFYSSGSFSCNRHSHCSSHSHSHNQHSRGPSVALCPRSSTGAAQPHGNDAMHRAPPHLALPYPSLPYHTLHCLIYLACSFLAIYLVVYCITLPRVPFPSHTMVSEFWSIPTFLQRQRVYTLSKG